MSDIKLFLAQPLNKVVYYIGSKKTKDPLIFNAATLQPISDMKNITTVIPIEGSLVAKYGVHPFVVSTASGTYHIVYAPQNDNYLYDHKGMPVKIGKLVSATDILIPDLDTLNNDLPSAAQLDTPNSDSLIHYNDLEETGNYSPAPIYGVSATPRFSPEPEAPNTGTIIEIAEIKNQYEDLNKKIQNLSLADIKKDIAQLYDIMEALTRRIYSMYPVNRKTPIRIGNIEPQEMSVDEYQKLAVQNKIKNAEFPPLMQPYAGSHRSDNRIMTVHDLSGNMFYVNCNFDPKTNQLSAPKYS